MINNWNGFILDSEKSTINVFLPTISVEPVHILFLHLQADRKLSWLIGVRRRIFDNNIKSSEGDRESGNYSERVVLLISQQITVFNFSPQSLVLFKILKIHKLQATAQSLYIITYTISLVDSTTGQYGAQGLHCILGVLCCYALYLLQG